MKNYKKFLILVCLNIISVSQIYSQIDATIPMNRIVDWTTVGYHNDPSNNLPTYTDSVIVSKPSNNPDSNYINITKKIIEASKKKGLVAVIFRNGVYKITKPINIGVSIKNIVLKGSGKTEILFLGKETKQANIIRIIGKPSEWKNEIKIIDYNNKTNTIKTQKYVNNIKSGDYVEIRVPNGSWHDSEHHKSWNPQNYFGTIVKVFKLNKFHNELLISHSLTTVWDLSQKENLSPTLVKFTPVQEIGIESLKLSTNNKNNRQGFNINFAYAANCWVKDVESVYAASAHLNIGNSTSIEARNSVFHHAKDYGNPAIPEKKIVAGTGYGVNVARSSNCIIENNIFYHLRHAMIIALGSNKNIFGYNFSYDQYSYPVKNLSDLNIHGHFPYNNLFEGNIVERIHADQWWGSNGPNNIFVNNLTTKGNIKLEKTNNAIVLGNKAKVILKESKSILEEGKLSEKSLNSFKHNNLVSVLEKYSLYKKKIVHNKNDFIPTDNKISVPKKKTTILKQEN